MADSLLPGFYRRTLEERRAELAARCGLSQDELAVLSPQAGLSDAAADHMVENAVGVLGIPVGVCANLQVGGVDRLVLMAVEEPSVVAAASHAAKLLRAGGGIEVVATEPHMVGQVQLLDVPDLVAAERAIVEATPDLLSQADAVDPELVAFGGGARALETRRLPPLGATDPCGPMLVVHIVVDVRDAMGANAVNSICEALAPTLASLSGGRARLRILSNLCDRRLLTARGRVPFAELGADEASGRALAQGIEEASVFAERDPYRAATHNKGIMNGVDAVLVAFGQDWRAVEAGAHGYAAREGRYTALARWRVAEDGLRGELTMPLAVGVVGGVSRVHPVARIARRVAGVERAHELAALAAAVGLAQNLGALRALAGEGIQRGHMRLHARNLAVAAGAEPHEVGAVAEALAASGTVDREAAASALARIRQPG